MALRWYIVHAYSNFEHRVKHSLEERIERMGLQDKFGEILVPTEEVVEMKEGASPKASIAFVCGLYTPIVKPPVPKSHARMRELGSLSFVIFGWPLQGAEIRRNCQTTNRRLSERSVRRSTTIAKGQC